MYEYGRLIREFFGLIYFHIQDVRIWGDSCKLVGTVALPIFLMYSGNATGISMKTQMLYILIHITRYLDMFSCWRCMSEFLLYGRIFCLTVSVVTVLGLVIYRKESEAVYDNFRSYSLVIPCLILSSFIPNSVMTEVAWVFSHYLEAVAILPQIHLMTRRQRVERIVVFYVLALTLYRLFYFYHWVQQYVEIRSSDSTSIPTAVVQMYFYLEFFLEAWRVGKDSREADGQVNNGAPRRNDLRILSVSGLLAEKRGQDHEEAAGDNEKAKQYNPLQSVVFTSPMPLNKTAEDKIHLLIG